MGRFELVHNGREPGEKGFQLTAASWWWQIDSTTMNAKNKKLDGKPARQKLKLPPGVVLLAQPADPAKDFKCVRCLWEWPARKKGDLPARCPHCSSPSWNRARVLSRRTGMQCHCRHCHWSWTANKPNEIPAMCPHCRRYDWNEQPAALPSIKPPGV
jgi:predicted Zn-ribbon and HTH transcriptional regulator